LRKIRADERKVYLSIDDYYYEVQFGVKKLKYILEIIYSI